MRQIYKDNKKRPKLKQNLLVILQIYTFCQKIQQGVFSPGESVAGIIYLPMRTHPKSSASSP